MEILTEYGDGLAGRTVCHRCFPADAGVADFFDNVFQGMDKTATLVHPRNRELGPYDGDLTWAGVWDTACPLEKRQAQDGCMYTRQQFMKYFGKWVRSAMTVVPDEEEHRDWR